MSRKKRKEVIANLTHTIETENAKPKGGNVELVKKLTERLESIKDGTFVSKIKKKK
jgi:hypothetical protein